MNILTRIGIGIGVLAMAASCSPDDYELVSVNVSPDDLVQGISYSVTADADNPNIIRLHSMMPQGYTVYWEHPQGRSQENDVELHIPFEGEYSVRFGVETRGGIVFSKPYQFNISTFCAEFVDNELWSFLSGGVGKSKEWIYDNGTYGYCSGEMSYGDPSANPDFGWNSFTANWEPEAGHCEDPNMWESVMTFSLDGGANYSYFNSSTGVTQHGIYGINTDEHTMAITDADLMHPDTRTARKTNWNTDFRIIALDENHMRIGYVRIPGDWGGEWLEVYNFVSKEYADNYVPPTSETEPTPDVKADFIDAFTIQNRYASWKLDTKVPYDWCNLDGTRKNKFSSPADYPAGFTPVEFEDDLKLKFATPSATGYKLTLPSGREVTGTFTMSSSGKLELSNGLAPFSLADGVMFDAQSDGSLQVLSYNFDESGRLEDMWLGRKECDITGRGIQYVGYHFLADFGGAQEPKSYKAELVYWNQDWTELTSEPVYIATEGQYAVTVRGSVTGHQKCCLYVRNLYKDHKNCDVTINEIVVDGNSLPFEDEVLKRTSDNEAGAPGDAAWDEARDVNRFIINQWTQPDPFAGIGGTAGAAKHVFSDSYTIKFTVVFDSGTPYRDRGVQ